MKGPLPAPRPLRPVGPVCRGGCPAGRDAWLVRVGRSLTPEWGCNGALQTLLLGSKHHEPKQHKSAHLGFRLDPNVHRGARTLQGTRLQLFVFDKTQK